MSGKCGNPNFRVTRIIPIYPPWTNIAHENPHFFTINMDQNDGIFHGYVSLPASVFQYTLENFHMVGR